MSLENIAPAEVRNKYMENIHAMFDFTGRGELLWSSLTDGEREMFCKQAGFQRSTAEIPLSKMRPSTRKQLFRTIKAIANAANTFNNLAFDEFG